MSESEREHAEMHHGDDVKLPKHMRLRYWTSWEELRILELWRKYRTDITTYQFNGPAFRTIAAGMKESGFHLNGQECRRKINSLKNKYEIEKRRMEKNGANKTDWRLYAIMQYLTTSDQPKKSLNHENETVKVLINEIPDLPQEMRELYEKSTINSVNSIVHNENKPQNDQTTRFSNDAVPKLKRRYRPRVSRSVIRSNLEKTIVLGENQPQNGQPKISNIAVPTLKRRNRQRTSGPIINRNLKKNDIEDENPTEKDKRRYRQRASRNIISAVSSTYMLKKYLTTAYLAQIRADNIRLEQKYYSNCKKLQAETREYEMLKAILEHWDIQNRLLLARS